MKLIVFSGTGSPGDNFYTRVHQSLPDRVRDFDNNILDTSLRRPKQGPSKTFTFQGTERPHEIESIKEAVSGAVNELTEDTLAPVIESYLRVVIT